MILLYSFEGTTFRYSDNNDGDTPISMPNIEVKPIGAESTWLEAAWKDRTLLNKETHHRDVMSFFSVLSFQALLCTHAGSKSYVLSTFDWHTEVITTYVGIRHGYRGEGKFDAGFCSGKEPVQLRFSAVLCTLGV